MTYASQHEVVRIRTEWDDGSSLEHHLSAILRWSTPPDSIRTSPVRHTKVVKTFLSTCSKTIAIVSLKQHLDRGSQEHQIAVVVLARGRRCNQDTRIQDQDDTMLMLTLFLLLADLIVTTPYTRSSEIVGSKSS
jgi:hypothetical protein